MWNALANYARQMGLFGENGGGILYSKDDLDERHLARMVHREDSYEEDNGYMVSRKISGKPHWIDLFHRYEEPEYAMFEIETRPAWFHLVNYVFFN